MNALQKNVTSRAPLPARREFLKYASCLTAAGAGALAAAPARASEHRFDAEHADAVLVDLSQCIGCRLCEYACKEANGIDPGRLESYDDQSVCLKPRRPEPDAFTVVNAVGPAPAGLARTTSAPATSATTTPALLYSKLNCMHCNYPACVSACIVGALEKLPNGAVTYDAWKCIGCRYCMVACPFQLPAYEYDNVLTPQVRKCQFCFHRTSEGRLPACVEACPQQALRFGKRAEVLRVAHERIKSRPGRHEDHVYGEHEIGGTSWLYLSPKPFEQAGFLTLGTAAPPALTEAIQHGVFKHWIAPVGLYTFFSTMMWFTGRRERLAKAHRDELPLHQSAEKNGTAVAVHHHRDVQEHPAPVERKLLTPGVWVLIGLVLLGLFAGLYRFAFGLAASTNLDQQHPWGLWIAMDVGSGIALAGGGFVTAALVHIFHREHYHAVARSALLTALLGYTFYVPGLLADIGRWYNIWHPMLPSMWQVNSVLFEVGICVMLYLTVQYFELAPIICERLLGEDWARRYPRFHKLVHSAHWGLEKILPALLVAGVTLSMFHQSSLGNLMVIAPYKLHPLWWSPLSPLMFLLSAMMVGFPMVIFTILFASWSLKRKPEMHVLSPLSLYIPVFLTMYLGVKIGDLLWRGMYSRLIADQPQGSLWMLEIVGGVILPLVLILIPRVRRSPKWLAISCLAVILGVVLNRLNCFVIAYDPPYATRTYFPSIWEFALSIGLVAALMLIYRIAVTYLPVLHCSEMDQP